MTRLRRYIEESWSELKKVTWPTREQMRNLTVLVFVDQRASSASSSPAVDYVFFQLIARLSELV